MNRRPGRRLPERREHLKLVRAIPGRTMPTCSPASNAAPSSAPTHQGYALTGPRRLPSGQAREGITRRLRIDSPKCSFQSLHIPNHIGPFMAKPSHTRGAPQALATGKYPTREGAPGFTPMPSRTYARSRLPGS